MCRTASSACQQASISYCTATPAVPRQCHCTQPCLSAVMPVGTVTVYSVWQAAPALAVPWFTTPGSATAVVVSSGCDRNTASQSTAGYDGYRRPCWQLWPQDRQDSDTRSMETVTGPEMLDIPPPCPIAAPAPWGLCMIVLTVILTQP